MINETRQSELGARRSTGIDFLKILPMFLVVLLHILGQGGVLSGVKPGSLNYYATWFVEIGAVCAVNCFAMVSGYTSVDKPFRLSRIIELYLQVFFYSVGIMVLFGAFYPEPLGIRTILRSFFPLSTYAYWYFTAFFALFFFMPFLNRMLLSLDRGAMKKLLLAVFLLLSLLPTLARADLFQTSSGYSLIWLMAMYILGAYIKKYGLFPRLSRLNLVLYVLCILLTMGSKFLGDAVMPLLSGQPRDGAFLISYTSPFVLGSAVFLFLFFTRVHLCARAIQRIAAFLSPLAFSVYLIHAHPLVWQYILHNRFAGFAARSPAGLVLSVFAAGAGIFIACVAIDLVRRELFRLMQISRFSGALARKIETLVHF